jgi:N-acetylneuraminic acid mutarotase
MKETERILEMKRLNGYRMRLVLVGFAAAVVLNGSITRADYIWTWKADMPIKKLQHSTSVVGGKIYSIGGWNAIGEQNPQWDALTRVDEYDPAADTWTRKADIPTARGDTSTCVVNEEIYVVGGDATTNISVVEVYDPATDTWKVQTHLPSRRYWVTTSVVDGIIYVFGGRNTGVIRTVEAYDPTTDTWTQKTDMPTGRENASSCVVDGKIYVIGGWAPQATAAVEAYDPTTDTWTAKAPMPTARYWLGASVIGGKIYAIGGWRHSVSGPTYSTVEVYDPQTDTWTKGVDIPITTAGLSASVVGGKIYVFGGSTSTHRNDHWVLTSAVYASDVIVDLNGDGIVDATDMCIVVDHWGTEDPLCDIAPPPFGDGIVDVQDLIVLAEHLFEEISEIFPPWLLAYWKLDDAEGDLAHNSITETPGILYGEPHWQPDSGQKSGALEFDGVDDYVDIGFVLNPAENAFSAFAWIKGGAPGQVILSQTDGPGGTGEIWLGADPSSGKLMTGIRPPAGRSPTPPMVADAVVTNGQWHYVGIVVTEQKVRNLYVDGTRAAFDTSPVVLPYSDGGLFIGSGKTLEAGTFFSGLIDDVRIYNKALSAEEIAALAQ